ncbi:MAG: hypothetical protein ACKVW3_11415 [Phycisphaerales bacterium]
MTSTEVGTPAGGYALVPAMGLLRAWWAFRAGIIRLVDLRVWLACFEVVERRCGLQKGHPVRYRLEELQHLLGTHELSALRTSVSTLQRAGFLDWSPSHVRLTSPASVDSLPEMVQAVASTKNLRRSVPVPRRVLRLLARTPRPVLIATVFAVLLRCVFRREGGVRSDGLVKSTWVAEVFGVHERNVKRARAVLRETGLLIDLPTSQWVLNRHGAGTRLNLEWCPPCNATPPRTLRFTAGSPPPRTTEPSLTGSINQSPGRGTDGPEARRSLGHIHEAELRSADGLRVVFERAAVAGLVRRCEADALNVAAAAARALRVADRNPCGLFASIVRGRWWHLVNHSDEEQGRRAVSAMLPPRARHSSRLLPRQLSSEPSLAESDIRELVRRSLETADTCG